MWLQAPREPPSGHRGKQRRVQNAVWTPLPHTELTAGLRTPRVFLPHRSHLKDSSLPVCGRKGDRGKVSESLCELRGQPLPGRCFSDQLSSLSTSNMHTTLSLVSFSPVSRVCDVSNAAGPARARDISQPRRALAVPPAPRRQPRLPGSLALFSVPLLPESFGT